MLGAWNYTENKLHHRCLENDFKKIFRTNILENGTRQILLIVALIMEQKYEQEYEQE